MSAPYYRLMLGHFGVFCGLRLPLLSHFRGILWFGSPLLGKSWDHIRLTLGHFGLPYWAYVGPLWAMSAPYWSHVGPFWCIPCFFCHCWARVETILCLSCTILGYVGHCGLCRHHIAYIYIYWAHVEPFWCIWWFVLAFVGQEFLAMLGHFGPRWHHIWLMLSHFSGILWFVVALVVQELGPYWAYLGHFWLYWDIFGNVGTV